MYDSSSHQIFIDVVHGCAEQKAGGGSRGSGYEGSALVHVLDRRQNPERNLELPLSHTFTSPLLSTRHLSGSVCESVQDFSATQYTLHTLVFPRGPVKHPVPETVYYFSSGTSAVDINIL